MDSKLILTVIAGIIILGGGALALNAYDNNQDMKRLENASMERKANEDAMMKKEAESAAMEKEKAADAMTKEGDAMEKPAGDAMEKPAL